MNTSAAKQIKFPLLGVLVFLLIMAVSFSLTLSKNHSDAEDAVAYAHHVTTGESLYQFHPNHLLYNAINRDFYLRWKSAGYDGDALLPMQVLNVITSLITLMIVALIGWRMGLTQQWVFLVLLTLVSCYGYWWYSVEVEAYLLPLPFALTAWFLTSQFIQSGKNYRLLIVAGCVAISILIHQQWIALFAAIGITLLIHWWRTRGLAEYQNMLPAIISAAALCIGIVILTYLLVISGYYSITSPEGIQAWIRGDQENVKLAQWSYLNPIKSLIGALRAVWGGHFVFGFHALQDLLTQTFPNKLLVEEIFLANSISAWIRWCCVVLSVLTIAIAALILVLSFSGRKNKLLNTSSHQKHSSQGYTLTGTVTIAVFFSLNIFVDPTNSELYIGILPIAILLIASRLSQRAKSGTAALSVAAFSVLLLVTNLLGSVIPQTNQKHDYWYAVNQYLIEKTTPSDVIISEGGYINDAYLRLFSTAKIERGIVMSSQRIAELKNQFSSGRMLVSSWTFKPPAGLDRQLQSYEPDKVKQYFQQYQLSVIAENSAQTIYLVE